MFSAEDLLRFCRERAAEAKRLARVRRDAKVAWTTGTEADHREAHKMAERMTGERVRYVNAAERKVNAEREERIAVKYDHEARAFDQLSALLELPQVVAAVDPQGGNARG